MNAGTVTDPDTPKILQLTDAVVVRQAIDNMGWLDLGDCLLVVDALEQPELEQEVMTAIQDTAGDKRVRYLLNTHTHYDHVALNDAFVRKCGTEIVNLRAAEIPVDGRVFEGSSRSARMIPMPGCHTAEDCVVWMPEDRVLFVGDIFGWGLIPWEGTLTTEVYAHLLATYRRLIEFDAEHVVPGHGPLCTNTELERWTEYLEWIVAQVREFHGNGKSTAEIMSAVAPPADMHTWWRFLQWKHEDTLKKGIRAVSRSRL